MNLTNSEKSQLAQVILSRMVGGKAKFFNGAIPANFGTPSGTKLADGNWTGAVGTENGSGLITFSAFSSVTNQVGGDPTFVRLERSDGSVHSDTLIGKANNTSASISGTTLTLSGTQSGVPLVKGMKCAGSGVIANTKLVSQLTATTWQVDTNHATPTGSVAIAFTGGDGYFDFTGSIAVGQSITGQPTIQVN